MKQMRLILLMLLVSSVVMPGSRAAIGLDQHSAAPVASSSWVSPPPLQLTAVIGERLEYLVSWSDYLVAAQLELTVAKGSTPPESLQLQATVQTVGLVRSLFIAVDDRFVSYVQPQSLLPFRFEADLREGRRHRQAVMVFDWKAGRVRLNGDEDIPIHSDTRDVIALFYHIRRLDLSSGKQYRLTGIYKHEPFTLIVRPEQKRVIDTPLGSVEAIEVALRTEQANGGKTRIDDEHRVRVWVTNDERRIPVLITARPAFGQVRARLRRRHV
ncbi:MAG: DUF3108 domain-containing protein [Acidobacteria bacterium]|nr:MAG: DUF3108 domain-containing protein [Acidobacteriota bacterium]